MANGTKPRKARVNRGTQQTATAHAGGVPPGSTRGSLIVIGTGIRTVGQLTMEAIAWMKIADALLYVVGDPIAEAVMQRLNPKGAVSDHILRSVRGGSRTVAAFYGHPGVFAYPSHESIRRARLEGFDARMLPAVSSEDCLFADLGVDPAVGGCQSYEASDFMLNSPVIDPSSQLVLWQIGTLGDWTYKRYRYDTTAMPLLVHAWRSTIRCRTRSWCTRRRCSSRRSRCRRAFR